MISKRLLGINRTVSTPAPAATDPYYAYRSLILNFDGNFNDSSPNALTVTPYGNAQIVSDATFGTVASFDGTGSSIAASSTLLDLGSLDFTAECWLYINSNPSGNYAQVMGKQVYGSSAAWLLYLNTSRVLLFGWNNTANKIQTSSSLGLNQWYHVAVTRSGATIKLFLDGVLAASSSISATLSSSTTAFTMGAASNGNSGSYLNALLGPLRISPWAEYTSNFTPSQDLFPAAQQLPVQDPWYDKTSLILNMDGTPGSTTFVDSSPNALAVTAVGNAQIVSDATFGTVASLDGSGDYLSVSDSDVLHLPSDFTIEAWVKITGGTNAIQAIYSQRSSGSSGFQASITYYNGAYQQWMWIDSVHVVTYRSGSALPVNQWLHLAWVRSGSSVKTYVDGVLNHSVTYTNTPANQNAPAILGESPGYSQAFQGEIGPTRITKGIARYTANFTPPTGPFPAS